MSSGEVLGSLYNQNQYSTARMRAVWTDENRLKVVCQAEIALAHAMADYGKIPESAYKEIAEKLKPEKIDMRALRLVTGRTGHFLAGFVQYVQQFFDDDSGQFVHYGAASEDIEDTCYVLQLKEAHAIIKEYMKDLLAVLAKLTKEHRDDLTAAIAHRTYASLTTLGFKLGIFLNEQEHLLTNLEKLESFSLAGSLANVEGLSSMIGDHSDEVESKFCDYLGLATPEMYWHTQRERFADYLHVVTEISQSLGRLGKELLYMSQTQVKEFYEPYAPGRQGSTVIPTSREPYMCEAMVNLSTVIRNEMSLMYDQMQVSGEKDTTVWRDLYVALPEMTMYLSGSLNYAVNVLKNGYFDTKQMKKNLALDDGTMFSGSIMMVLSKKMGRENAHDLMYRLRVKADNEHQQLKDVMLADSELGKYLTNEQLKELMTPNAEKVKNADFKVNKILTLFSKHHPEIHWEEK